MYLYALFSKDSEYTIVTQLAGLQSALLVADFSANDILQRANLVILDPILF